ncbi:hypothetical protein ILUMI_22265 [Ignelater luminosus]|uniref:DDE-1 domain-containing protein n=1 Tax=Ignelater luminosus TaxID=2038154 RepID=A0A8K0CAE5_IGNLU|nr:hypothetical protein ILUMI_22265 [Ignelater luminosus]
MDMETPSQFGFQMRNLQTIGKLDFKAVEALVRALEEITFSIKQEELSAFLKHIEKRLFGLTSLDLRQLAVENDKKHNFSIKKEMAGVDWLKGFLKRVSLDNTVLLLLDGHVRHTQNIEVINVIRPNEVIILCFPPHCTHRLQPVEIAVMRPLSTYYDHAATNWLRSHLDRFICVSNKRDIWTSIPQQLIHSRNSESSHGSELHIEPEPDPSRSYVTEARSPIRTMCRDLASSFKNVSPLDVIPISSVQAKEKRKQYRRGKTAVITSTRYKMKLEDMKQLARISALLMGLTMVRLPPAVADQASSGLRMRRARSSNTARSKVSKLHTDFFLKLGKNNDAHITHNCEHKVPKKSAAAVLHRNILKNEKSNLEMDQKELLMLSLFRLTKCWHHLLIKE